MIDPKPRAVHAAPMALRSAMAKLGRDMQAVAGGISTEDWTLVARLAPDIARHPGRDTRGRPIARVNETALRLR